MEEHQGLTPDEIVTNIPSITLGDVHAAFAWYFDHVEEIQADMRAERALVDEARRNHSSQFDTKRLEDHQEASGGMTMRFHLDQRRGRSSPPGH